MQGDDEEARILDKMIKEIIKKTEENQKKASSKFPLQGVYEFVDGRWQLTAYTKNWNPKEDGLYVIFNDDFDSSFLSGPFGDPFLKIAENVGGSIKSVVKTFKNFERPYLTFICIYRGKELFSKRFDALPWLSDVATLVSYFGINCPSVKKTDLLKIYDVCPCAKLW